MARSPSPFSDSWWLEDDAPSAPSSARSSLEVHRSSSPPYNRALVNQHQHTVERAQSSTAPLNSNKNATPPPPPHSPSAAAKAQLAASEAAFWNSFPNGWHTITTSMEGLLCGFFAAINSMRAQYPSLPCPTREELQDIFDEQAREFAEVFDMCSTYNFSIDQVAAVVYRWGRERGLNLRIGYVEDGSTPLLVSHPNEEGDVRVLWIHNDGRWNGGIGHFSGIRHLYEEVTDFPPETHEKQTLDRLMAMKDDVFEADNDGVPMDISTTLSESTLVGDEDITMAQEHWQDISTMIDEIYPKLEERESARRNSM